MALPNNPHNQWEPTTFNQPLAQPQQNRSTGCHRRHACADKNSTNTNLRNCWRRCHELQRDGIALQMRLQWNRKSMLLSSVANNSTPWEKQMRHNRLDLRMNGSKGEHLLVTKDGDKSFWKRSAPVTFCGVSTML